MSFSKEQIRQLFIKELKRYGDVYNKETSRDVRQNLHDRMVSIADFADVFSIDCTCLKSAWTGHELTCLCKSKTKKRISNIPRNIYHHKTEMPGVPGHHRLTG